MNVGRYRRRLGRERRRFAGRWQTFLDDGPLTLVLPAQALVFMVRMTVLFGLPVLVAVQLLRAILPS